jgi:hypothetical protein
VFPKPTSSSSSLQSVPHLDGLIDTHLGQRHRYSIVSSLPPLTHTRTIGSRTTDNVRRRRTRGNLASAPQLHPFRPAWTRRKLASELRPLPHTYTLILSIYSLLLIIRC